MNKEQALEIVEVLTDKKMLLHTMLFKKTVFQKNTITGKFESHEKMMVMAIV